MRKRPPTIDRIHPGFAAIDLGSEKHFIALAGQPVRHFLSFTADLRRLCAYLQEHHVTHVAMEATGVYWMPLYDALQTAGLHVTLFNGAHARNLPGRKSDVQDCEWHAMLHSFGLLQACFVTPEALRPLRTYTRLREAQIRQAAEFVQHMQRACDQMNIRLHNVISELHGVSGLRVIDAILRGVREPRLLASLCDGRILKHKEAAVLASLEGTWHEHHLFELQQARDAYRFCQDQIAACDQQITLALQVLNAARPPQPCAPGEKAKPMRHNVPQVPNLHQELRTLCGGCDGQLLPALTAHSWLKLAAELGPDLSHWQSDKHFTAWSGLSPGRAQSGKRCRRLSRRKTRVGQIFREAAMSLARTKDCALGAFYRRLRGKRGAAVANVATARKLAALYWRVMTKGMRYVEQGLAQYEAQQRAQQTRYFHKLASKLGYTVTAKEADAAA